MNVLYSILVVIAVIVAIAFSLLVLVTGKGDAMSGGGSVRTTFKGKASFDDIMSKWTLYIGVAFMAIVLIINIVVKKLAPATAAAAPAIERSVDVTPLPSSSTATNVPPSTSTNSPASTPSAPSAPTPNTNLPTNTGNASGANAPLDSTPATAPSANAPTNEPSVIPTTPGTNSAAGTNAG